MNFDQRIQLLVERLAAEFRTVYLKMTGDVLGTLTTLTTTDKSSIIAAINEIVAGGVGGGVTDHGELDGLPDDDHPQYLTNARGDLRYDAIGAADAAAAAGIAAAATAQAFAIQRANHTGVQSQATITNLVADLAAKADLVGGVLRTDQIPAIALTEYLGSVASEAAMLALVGQPGDWAIRTDVNSNAVIVGPDPSDIDDWIIMPHPASPVISVNGQIGVVVLGKSDVGLANVDNTSDVNKPISTATQNALNLKLDANAAIVGATKTKITYGADGLVTAGADATTADIADSADKRYVTEAEKTKLANTTGVNSGDQDLSALIAATTGLAASKFWARAAAAGAAAAKDITDIALALLDDLTEEAMRDTLKIGARWCAESRCDFGQKDNVTTANAPGYEWSRDVSGTNANVNISGGLTSGNSAGRAQLALGTTTTGRTAWMTDTLMHAAGYGVIEFNLKGQMVTLSDATNTYVQRLGFLNDNTAEPTAGAYFRYTHSVNSGKWQAVCRQGGVETAVDAGVTAVAGTERHWQIRSNAAGTEWKFYIDGTLVATISTNVPTNRCGFMAAAIRSAGTTGIASLQMDIIHYRIDFTTPRW